MATACSPDQIKSALFEEADIVTDIVREEIENSDRIALRMTPDGGTVERHDNNDTIIYGEARQASRQYGTLDTPEVRDLETAEMSGRTQAGNNGIFAAEINDIDDNACHGQCTIDFSQGFRRRGTSDFELSVDTPIKCVRELDRLGKEHIRGYFKGFNNQFSRWGMDNYSDNLMNLIIQNGEANASVLAADQFNVSTNGWQAPPEKRITIHFLQDYADHIRAEIKGRGKKISEDWMLEVEMPRIDWMDAVKKDQEVRNPSDTRYQSEIFKDDEGPMRGRSFGTYGGIKCFFNDYPIRGYFKQTGIVGGFPNFNFVRVYEWINTQDETGGINAQVNHDYRKDTINVDGVFYDMCTLIPHIDVRSFKRYGLMKPLKPIGGSNSGVNYQVQVIDGPYLDCNEFQDKFKLVARHEFRFKALYPEFSGFIAYRHSQRPGYALEVTPRDYSPGDQTPAGTEVYDACNDDSGCGDTECAQCGKVADIDGDCVAAVPETSVLNIEPGGAVASSFFGDAYSITLRVTRTGDTTGPASAIVTTAHVTTDDTDFLDGVIPVAWLAGDSSPKDVVIDILGTFTEAVGGTPDVFTATLSTPVTSVLGTSTLSTVSVSDDS